MKVELSALPRDRHAEWNHCYLSQEVSEFGAVEVEFETLELNQFGEFLQND